MEDRETSLISDIFEVEIGLMFPGLTLFVGGKQRSEVSAFLGVMKNDITFSTEGDFLRLSRHQDATIDISL